MRRLLLLLTLMGAIVLATTGVVLAQQSSPSDQQQGIQPSSRLAPPLTGKRQPVCPGPAAPGTAHCNTILLLDATPEAGNDSTGTRRNAAPAAIANVPGYYPADLQSAYNVVQNVDSSATPNGPIVAIVAAFDAQNAQSDLAVYRKNFGLPPCTKQNGCFTKIDQNGGTRYPTKQSWADEISVDLDMVSAICPNCRILLVEASSTNFSDLGQAVNTAAKYTIDGENVAAISNSYSGPEQKTDQNIQKRYYDHPGIAITASSGDTGYGKAESPASFPTVTAVGGTSLIRDPNTSRGWSETAWSGSGSGCSAYFAKPPWQKTGGCKNRIVADVAAVADPNTGVAFYNTNPQQGQGGWQVVGGTSVSAPIIATLYTLAGVPSDINDASDLYRSKAQSGLWDIISGTNGSCSTAYLCTARNGYDGPTGNGTPNGESAF